MHQHSPVTEFLFREGFSAGHYLVWWVRYSPKINPSAVTRQSGVLEQHDFELPSYLELQ